MFRGLDLVSGAVKYFDAQLALQLFDVLALVPQAGVAIGLAFLGKRILPPDAGNMLLTIILASSVLYELIGPVSAKLALILSGSIRAESAPVATASLLRSGR